MIISYKITITKLTSSLEEAEKYGLLICSLQYASNSASVTLISFFRSFLFPSKTKGYVSGSGGFKLLKNSFLQVSIFLNESTVVKSKNKIQDSEFL